MTQIVGKVYRTDDLSMFKKLEGNRSITDGRVAKIKKSIQTVGYVSSPIVVNERYEIIDGQGRVEALKQLGLPVEYVIAKGAGLEECIALNINLTNWRITDYIDSYASTGNESYRYLQLLFAEYGKKTELHVILNAVNGSVESSINNVKRGKFLCSTEDYNRARKILDYEMLCNPYIDNIPGRKRFYLMGIGFCYLNKNIDTKRLLAQLKARGYSLPPAPTIKIALEEIEGLYNLRIQKKVYIYNDYQKYQDSRNSWYRAKWIEGGK